MRELKRKNFVICVPCKEKFHGSCVPRKGTFHRFCASFIIKSLNERLRQFIIQHFTIFKYLQYFTICIVSEIIKHCSVLLETPFN